MRPDFWQAENGNLSWGSRLKALGIGLKATLPVAINCSVEVSTEKQAMLFCPGWEHMKHSGIASDVKGRCLIRWGTGLVLVKGTWKCPRDNEEVSGALGRDQSLFYGSGA